MISWASIGRARTRLVRRACVQPAGVGPAWVRLVAAALLCLGASCSTGATVNLGAQAPRPYHFGTPRLHAELGTANANDNPTLTADLLDLYFTSARDANATDVWTAHRASVSEPFTDVAPVTAANSPFFETSAAISLDALTLWVGTNRAAGVDDLDIWVLSRPTRDAPWSAPRAVPELNSLARDVPRPPGQHGLVMPLASERDSPGLYRTYLSERSTLSAPFGPPRAIPELISPNLNTVDAFLTDDGLTLFFSSSPSSGAGDLFVASRRSLAEPFSSVVPLEQLNTASDERDPWLSPDGQTLFFSSDRDGILNIYEVAASRS
jgi:hypothetical protein